ncbi:MAG: hypoxanthine phosphoribosyltransferase [Actinomycetota bacterium]
MTAEPIAEVLIDRTRLRRRIDELAAELDDELRGREPAVLVGILKGSTLFLSDLVRCLTVDVVVDFMSISSYSSGGSGVVRIVKDLDEDVAGRDVVVVEDIVDTGLTLNYLRRTLEARGARSLRTIALLDKAARRIVPVPVEHIGFEIPDVFVVGYGLDFQGRYRNLADILAVKDIARLANDPTALVATTFRDGSTSG